jgi:S1-C subfamily serine protease
MDEDVERDAGDESTGGATPGGASGQQAGWAGTTGVPQPWSTPPVFSDSQPTPPAGQPLYGQSPAGGTGAPSTAMTVPTPVPNLQSPPPTPGPSLYGQTPGSDGRTPGAGPPWWLAGSADEQQRRSAPGPGGPGAGGPGAGVPGPGGPGSGGPTWPGWVPPWPGSPMADQHGLGQPGWPPAQPQSGRGGAGSPPPPPFYGQHGGYLPPYDPYGWARYGAPPPDSGRRRRGSGALVAVATLVVVALLAGGLGAGLGVAFGGRSSASSPTASSGGPLGGPLGGAGSGSGATGNSGTAGSEPATSGNSSAVRKIADKVEPAVVDIDVNDASAGPAAGTGMIITSSGYVLTNNHVIDSATSIEVDVQGRSSPYTAQVVGYDATHDVAVVKIEGASGLPTVSLGNSGTVSIGETVVALGNALGEGGTPAVVSGTVTALGRSISAGDEITGVPESLHNLIQTDAEIQQGDSGGPLVNADGQVVGMDTAAASAESGSTLGFAIPINQARSIADQIMRRKSGNGVTVGLAAFLGIDVENGTNGSAGSSGSNAGGGGLGFPFGSSGTTGSSGAPAVSGVTVSNVVEGSPAAQAGLQGGDVITAIDGKATPTFADLHRYIQAHKPGQQITLRYMDETGASHTVTVTLAGIAY